MEVSKEQANDKRAGTATGILEPNPLVVVEGQYSLAKCRIFLRGWSRHYLTVKP